MKVYQKDVLYGQGDQSEEIFFIIKGRVKFYYNTNFKQIEAQPNLVPINLHVEGSYFGDNDVLINSGRDGRDSSAIADVECQLLVINKY
jgi:CRP-like cAMP-binding protein